METVNQNTPMKSGDKFIYTNSSGTKIDYTLQKFPDFNLWMLIDNYNGMWMHPMDTSFGAFGGWHDSFSKA